MARPTPARRTARTLTLSQREREPPTSIGSSFAETASSPSARGPMVIAYVPRGTARREARVDETYERRQERSVSTRPTFKLGELRGLPGERIEPARRSHDVTAMVGEHGSIPTLVLQAPQPGGP